MKQKSKKFKILFLDILTDNKYLRKDIEKKVYGGSTYAKEMREAFGLDKKQFVTIDASRSKLPNPTKYSAVVMGGSVKDPVKGQERPWMKRVYKFIRLADKKRVPILGICGGLQFTVRALGGRIIYNSKGRNFGNSLVKLNSNGRKDLLFKNLPTKIIVQSSHKCIAKTLRPGWKLLASSKKSPLDVIAIGDKIRLLQFHPEMKPKVAKGLAKMRKETLIAEGFVDRKNFPKLLKSLKDTSKVGKKLLQNFLEYFVMANI